MNFEQGVYTVIPTYFKDRDIDMESIFNVIRYQINNSIKNIVLLGTTSETSTLTQEDKNMIVTNVWNEFNHKMCFLQHAAIFIIVNPMQDVMV